MMINIEKDLNIISFQSLLIEHKIDNYTIEQVCKSHSCSYILNICVITLCTRYNNSLIDYLKLLSTNISKYYNTDDWIIYHYLVYSICPGEFNTVLLSSQYKIENFTEVDDDIWYIRMCNLLNYLSFWMTAPDDNIQDVRQCVQYVKDNTDKYKQMKGFYEKDLFDNQ